MPRPIFEEQNGHDKDYEPVHADTSTGEIALAAAVLERADATPEELQQAFHRLQIASAHA